MSEQRLEWVRQDVEVLCDLGRRDPVASVPSCPGWSIADLVAHVSGSFSGWWAYTLSSSAHDEINAGEYLAANPPPIPAQPGDAVDMLAEASARWLRQAHQVDPAKPTWTFDGPGRADFWFGRASTECALHRWDADGAFSEHPAIPTERAADAITETIDALFPAVVNFGIPAPPGPLAVIPNDVDDHWVVVPTDAGLILDDTATPEVTLSGDASSLCLFLHGREAPTVEISDTGKWPAWDQLVRIYAMKSDTD